MAKFLKSGVWDKVPEGSTLTFGDTQSPSEHVLFCLKKSFVLFYCFCLFCGFLQ